MAAIGLDATPDPVIIASDETAPPLFRRTLPNIDLLNVLELSRQGFASANSYGADLPHAAITSRRRRPYATTKKGHFLVLHPILLV